MRNYTFIVTFERSGTEMVGAGNAAEATILAQAIRIKQGLDWTVMNVRQLEE